jgi:hypothetical protein
MMQAGHVHVACPACDTIVPVPVHCNIAETTASTAELICTPDMADLWAHVWTHDE